jgi:hypothetical protein
MALGPVVAQGATVANWSWGWMETLATLSRRGLARPVGSDLVGIVPGTEIKAFWWLRQTVKPPLLFYSYLTGFGLG